MAKDRCGAPHHGGRQAPIPPRAGTRPPRCQSTPPRTPRGHPARGQPTPRHGRRGPRLTTYPRPPVLQALWPRLSIDEERQERAGALQPAPAHSYTIPAPSELARWRRRSRKHVQPRRTSSGSSGCAPLRLHASPSVRKFWQTNRDDIRMGRRRDGAPRSLCPS